MAKKKTETERELAEWRRIYYIAHREERLAYAKQYYETNKEKILQKLKTRSAEDPDYAKKKKAYHKKYYRKKKAERKRARAAAKREEQS